jgi:GNAT superfamily N-acetyltransferase
MPDDQIQRELEFQPASLENLDRLTELYRASFKVNPTPGYFNWKYIENPGGKLLGFEATHHGRVVASYGVIPEHYLVNGQRRVVWQSMDTMTHPDYQRRGLFAKLANMTFDALRAYDHNFLLLGIPAPESHVGFVKKLGWSDIHTFGLIFTDKRAQLGLGLLRRKSPVSFREVTDTETLRPYLESRMRISRHIQNELSPEFLAWRGLTNPMHKINIMEFSEGGTAKGIVAYSVDDPRKTFVYLLDFGIDEDVIRLTPTVVREVLDRTGASVLSTWTPMDHLLGKGFFRAGVVANPTSKGPMLFKQPFIGLSGSSKFEGLDALSARSFMLQPIMQD